MTQEHNNKQLMQIAKFISKDKELSTLVNNIISNGTAKEEIETKLIILLNLLLPKMKKKFSEIGTDQNANFDESALAKDISKLAHLLNGSKTLKNLVDSKDSTLQIESEEDIDTSNITNRSKRNLKKLFKEFITYEIYKVMSPNQIAGETKLQNFLNNMHIGGFKLASKYAGGKKADLKNYSAHTISRANLIAKKSNIKHKTFNSGMSR